MVYSGIDAYNMVSIPRVSVLTTVEKALENVSILCSLSHVVVMSSTLEVFDHSNIKFNHAPRISRDPMKYP